MLLVGHDVGLAQDFQVLRDRPSTLAKRSGQPVNGGRTRPQTVENGGSAIARKTSEWPSARCMIA
jgi:hypothetical protein